MRDFEFVLLPFLVIAVKRMSVPTTLNPFCPTGGALVTGNALYYAVMAGEGRNAYLRERQANTRDYEGSQESRTYS